MRVVGGQWLESVSCGQNRKVSRESHCELEPNVTCLKYKAHPLRRTHTFHIFPVHILSFDTYIKYKAYAMKPYLLSGAEPLRTLKLSSMNFDFRDFPRSKEWKEMESESISQE